MSHEFNIILAVKVSFLSRGYKTLWKSIDTMFDCIHVETSVAGGVKGASFMSIPFEALLQNHRALDNLIETFEQNGNGQVVMKEYEYNSDEGDVEIAMERVLAFCDLVDANLYYLSQIVSVTGAAKRLDSGAEAQGIDDWIFFIDAIFAEQESIKWLAYFTNNKFMSDLKMTVLLIKTYCEAFGIEEVVNRITNNAELTRILEAR